VADFFDGRLLAKVYEVLYSAEFSVSRGLGEFLELNNTARSFR
jgi:hypothetical protein